MLRDVTTGTWYDRLRHPVRRAGGEQYLLLMLVSFGGSVILTRWYLELAGYPQIATGSCTSRTRCGAGCCCSSRPVCRCCSPAASPIR